MIDLYCERLEPGLWAEPVNAITNLAFFAAAVAIAKCAGSHRRMNRDAVLLIGLIIAIGAGSSLFHTFATVWAAYLDEIPILLFQLVFLWLYARRIMSLARWQATLLLAIFIGLVFFVRQLPPILNGSLIYAPALMVLILLGVFHRFRAQHEPYLLLVAAGVFLVALLFRTLDLAICDQLAVGTHFLWHLFIGLVLYLVSRGFMLNYNPIASR